MNWYKFALGISSLEDRNIANAKIMHLEHIAQRLDKAGEIVFQTQRGARRMIQSIMADKRLSSYPTVLEILHSADNVAMDSPHKFQTYCQQSVSEIMMRVGDLKEERRKYTQENRPAKGWFQD